ncbi:hypothetical protein BDZ91DRAFT_722461 [Kalaharituber pfeilii]|nr:hypothetical protein BDZ91DRAFT_722461 [Kalaharituber pfeilii]
MYQDPAIAKCKALTALPPPGKPHGVALPETARPGRTPVYRHWRAVDGLLETIDPKIRTLHEMFEHSAELYPNNKSLGWRERDPVTGTYGPYVWMTYKEVHERRKNLAAGLRFLHEKQGVTEEKYGIGLWSPNRPEWQITDLAATCQALYTVSIYDTLGPAATEYIVNHALLKVVVCSLNHVPTLLSIKDRCPDLKIIISMDPLDNGELPGYSKQALLSAWAKEKGVELYYLRDVEALGAKYTRDYKAPTPDDIVTINYTSGTTGNPKGVVLTHRAAVAAASSAHISSIHQTPRDSMLSYLPLAHIYGRLGEHLSMWAGASIGYFHGNILELTDDLKVLRPTIFFSVPRLFQRFYTAIQSATLEAPGVKGALSRHVVSTKLANMKANPIFQGSNTHALYDKIWAKKVSAAIGLERTHGMVTGSAPIDGQVLDFLRIVFANNFIQGYGLTETYAVAMGQLVQDNSAGSCGPPAMPVEVCLRSVPDMEYNVEDKPYPRGELLIRGPIRFKEYFREPELTKAAIDEEGWFATGDICSVDELGRFTIIDRVKNILKLAQGEYVSPERIENNLMSHMPILMQAYVHGDSLQSFLVGIFGVDREHFSAYASKILGKTISATDEAALLDACRNKRVRQAVVADMDNVIKKTSFQGFERVRNAHLCLDPFTIDNELLTPTLKLKRPQAAKAFRNEIDALYEEANRELTGQVKAML